MLIANALMIGGFRCVRSLLMVVLLLRAMLTGVIFLSRAKKSLQSVRWRLLPTCKLMRCLMPRGSMSFLARLTCIPIWNCPCPLLSPAMILRLVRLPPPQAAQPPSSILPISSAAIAWLKLCRRGTESEGEPFNFGIYKTPKQYQSKANLRYVAYVAMLHLPLACFKNI